SVAGNVGGAVVQHQVHLEPGRDLGVQVIEEGDEVDGGVAVQVGGGEDPAAVDVQGSQQDRGAVAHVLVLLAGHSTPRWSGGGAGSATRRHAGLLVHAQHQGIGGGDQVQPTNDSGPLPEAGAVRAGDPAAPPVGLDVQVGQDPADLGGRDALSERA